MSLLLDLHTHSKFSGDSRLEPREIIRLARDRGLNGVAITDHKTVRSGLLGGEINTDPRFHLIPGVEYATEYGHVVGLFLERELDDLPVRSDHSVPFERVVRAIHAQGGIAVLAHPFQSRLSLPVGPFAGPVRLDAVEGFNARAGAARNPGANAQALEFAVGNGIPAVGGSDAHLAWEVGRGLCRVDGVEPGAPDALIKEAILAGRVTPLGRPSPRIVIPLSQITRMWNSRRFSRAPRIAVRLALAALGPVGLWLENLIRGPLQDPEEAPTDKER